MYIYTRVYLYEFLEAFLLLGFDTLTPWIYIYLAADRKICRHFSQGRLKSLFVSPRLPFPFPPLPGAHCLDVKWKKGQ